MLELERQSNYINPLGLSHAKLHQIYGSSIEYTLKSQSDPDKLFDKLRAVLFEQACYSHLSLSLSQNGTRLLSPEETLEYYKENYPHRRAFKDVFIGSLDGIRAFDGLLVADGKIQQFLEYTLKAGDRHKFLRKFKGFSLQKSKLPNVADQVRMAYVVPADAPLAARDLFSIVAKSERGHISLIKVPFSRKAVHIAASRFFRNFTPTEDFATLDYIFQGTQGFVHV